MDWLLGIAALMNAFAAVAAWAVNTLWSKKYDDAKNETITSLKSTIENLKASHSESLKAKDASIDTIKLTIENLKTSHSESLKLKDIVIEAKNASIDAIKENTPQFVSAAYKATVEMFEDNFKRMQEKLAQTEKEISNLEALKVSLSEEIHNLQEEKNELMSENEYLRPLAEAMEGYIDHQKDLEAEGLEDVAW